MASCGLEEGGIRSIRRPGILALLNEALPMIPYDPEILAESTRHMRKHKRPTLSQPVYQNYDPTKSTFTLVFIGDSKNLNAIRFRPQLVDFCQRYSEDVQGICVLNRDGEESFCDGTGFAYITFDHPNRNALLALLAVQCIPSVVVIENQTGRRITDLGMQAIEMNSNNPKLVLARWRNRESGLDSVQWSKLSCSVS